VASDLHPAFGPLFNPSLSEDARKAAVAKVEALLSQVNRHMEGRTFVAGDHFSLADAYLFTVFGWTKFQKIPTDQYTHMSGYMARIAERPAVRNVMQREGLLG
jgi:glutathione S-transferase